MYAFALMGNEPEAITCCPLQGIYCLLLKSLCRPMRMVLHMFFGGLSHGGLQSMSLYAS